MTHREEEIHNALNYLSERHIHKEDLVEYETPDGLDFAYYIGLTYVEPHGVLAVLDTNEDTLKTLHYSRIQRAFASLR